MIELSRYVLEALRKGEEFTFYRGRSKDDASRAAFASYGAPLILDEANVSQEPRRSVSRSRVLLLSPLAEYPAPEILKSLEQAYSLREEVDPKWAARPIAMARYWDRTVLVLEDPGGVPLSHLFGLALDASGEPPAASRQPLDIRLALRLAISLSAGISALHPRGIIHKDINPANILASSVTGQCWLTGFGIASRLSRERQPPEPPEFIAGTLPYMAPEQTGRMNRSIDSRSDLYALGVVLYEMLTGNLPFSASDPSSDGSSFAYVCLGMIAGPNFGNYQDGIRFGQLGYELVEKRGLKRFQARTYTLFGSHVMPWKKHVRACRDLVHRAFEAANEAGDLVFAAASCSNLNTNLLAAGDPLKEVQREAEHGLEFAQKARFVLVTPQLGLTRTLRSLTPKFGCFDDGQFDELRFERHLASDPAALPECFYWIRKLQARFFAGDYASAVDASLRAQQLLWTAPSHFEMAEYHGLTVFPSRGNI